MLRGHDMGDRRPLKTRAQGWVPLFANFLLKRGCTPDYVSIFGIVCAVSAAAFFVLAHKMDMRLFFVGSAIFIQLRLLCNMMDGFLAVEGGKGSKFGDIFNEVPDRYEDILILVATGYAASATILGWVAAALAVLTAYTRAFAGTLGVQGLFLGPMAKPHRMFVLTLACLIEAFIVTDVSFLTVALWIVIIGCFITLYRRTYKLIKEVE